MSGRGCYIGITVLPETGALFQEGNLQNLLSSFDHFSVP